MAPMVAVIGGRGLERKLRLIDGLLERVDAIHFVGEIAVSIYRVLYTKQLVKAARRERKPVARFEAMRLIAVVERLMEKAYRKQVRLLLPSDFVVGDSPLELDGASATTVDDGDDDDDDEPHGDDEDEDDDSDDDDSDARKKKAKKKKEATAIKPLEEPPEVDTWRPKLSYEGERSLVELDGNGWMQFADVTLNIFGTASVVEGKGSVLDAADDETEAEEPSSLSPTMQRIRELDWTQRIFDVGPKSTRSLLDHLRATHVNASGWIFVSGTLGVVEYKEFETATRHLVELLQSSDSMRTKLLATGKSTCRWLTLLGLTKAKRGSPPIPVVPSHIAKLEAALSYVVESKAHATLTAFDSST